jgi:hypothetical protein
MNTVGIFAGRGDVILSMGIAFAFGIGLGWYARGIKERIAAWRNKQ